MKEVILILVALQAGGLFAYDSATIDQVFRNEISLTVGKDIACALDNAGVNCWKPGDLERYKNPLPFGDVLEVTARGETSGPAVCGLEKGAIQCFQSEYQNGSWEREEWVPSELSGKITAFTRRWDEGCVIVEGKVKCWGRYGRPKALYDGPQVENPRWLGRGYVFNCAASETSLKCSLESGADEFHKDRYFPMPEKFHKIKDLSVGKWHVCVIDQITDTYSELGCWGPQYNRIYGESFVVPSFKNPTQVSVGDHTICVVANKEVKCWSDPCKDWYGECHENGPRSPTVVTIEGLINPTQVSVGEEEICVVHDLGVKCTKDVPEPLTRMLHPGFVLEELEKSIEHLSKITYAVKRDYFLGLLKILKGSSQISAEERYYVLTLAGAMVETTDSSLFDSKIIPTYQAAKARYAKQLGMTVSPVPISEFSVLASFVAVENAVQGSKSFATSLEDRAALESTLMQVGKLKSEIQRMSLKDKAAKLCLILTSQSSLITKLSEESRTRGFGIVLQLVKKHLGRAN